MSTSTQRYERTDLQEALRVLRAGGVILYPTDTVWGIGCDATNAEAVARVYAIKQREDTKSMLCLLDAPGKLQGYVREVPEMAWQLLEMTEQAPAEDGEPERPQRPLTIIYPDAINLAKNLVAEDGSIGIRITREPFTKALCEQLHAPIVSTSANISGQPTARNFSEISEEIRSAVDYVCLFRRNDHTPQQPSSIIKLDRGNLFTIIRP